MGRVIIKKTIELEKDAVDWFQENYGGSNKASLSWALNLLLVKFKEAHETTPKDLAAIGAAELKRILTE